MFCAINGYRALFAEPVPEHLICAICRHALRQPVKSLACGHLFCKLCFEMLRSYYQMLNQAMICPVDKVYFPPTMVLEEKTVERNVLLLDVRCNYLHLGCRWIGPLKALEIHKNMCPYAKTPNTKQASNSLQTSNTQLVAKNHQAAISQHDRNEEKLKLIEQKGNDLEAKLTKALERIEYLEETVRRNEETMKTREIDMEIKENQLKSECSATQSVSLSSSDDNAVCAKSSDVIEKCENRHLLSLLHTVKEASLKTVDPEVEDIIKEASMLSINAEDGKGIEQREKISPQEQLLNDVTETIFLLHKRLYSLEKRNSFGGFFAWTIQDLQKFKTSGGSLINSDVKTSTFGFSCRLIANWHDINSMAVTFEVLNRTPRTAHHLPFFCEFIIACVADDGEVLSRKINYINMSYYCNKPDVLCFTEINDFLCFPRNNKFIVNDKLQLFGYFMPFDPADDGDY